MRIYGVLYTPSSNMSLKGYFLILAEAFELCSSQCLKSKYLRYSDTDCPRSSAFCLANFRICLGKLNDVVVESGSLLLGMFDWDDILGHFWPDFKVSFRHLLGDGNPVKGDRFVCP